MVAKLLYVAKRTRPYLLTLISFLKTRVLHATEEDQDKLRKGLRYLNSTKSMGIIRLWSSGDNRIRAYIDASYGIHHDRKSHAGLYLTLGGGPISVKSCKLRLMVKSSTEDVFDCTMGLEVVARVGLQCKVSASLQDYLSAMQLATNRDSSSGKSKHIEIRNYI